MISAVLKDLSEAAAERRLVGIVRREPLQKLTGFPLALGSRLLLLHDLNPDLLLPDGFALVRLQDVAEVRSTEWEWSVQRALAGEGRLEDPAGTPAVRLDGWAGALADLHARGERLSVDCEDDDDAYFLGAVAALDAESVDILHICADGRCGRRGVDGGLRRHHAPCVPLALHRGVLAPCRRPGPGRYRR